MYEGKESILFISEPQPNMDNFEFCYRMDYGVFKFSENHFEMVGGKMEEVGQKILKYIKDAKGFSKCNKCRIDNNKTVEVKWGVDYCLSCLTYDETLKKMNDVKGEITKYEYTGED